VTILNWPGVSVNNAYRVDQKSKPAYCCNNFVYFQPVFVILARVHCKIFATGRCIVSPPNTICETLPCKIFITTLFMFRSKFYRLSLLIPSRRNVQYLTSPYPTKYKTSRKKSVEFLIPNNLQDLPLFVILDSEQNVNLDDSS